MKCPPKLSLYVPVNDTDMILVSCFYDTNIMEMIL